MKNVKTYQFDEKSYEKGERLKTMKAIDYIDLINLIKKVTSAGLNSL